MKLENGSFYVTVFDDYGNASFSVRMWRNLWQVYILKYKNVCVAARIMLESGV